MSWRHLPWNFTASDLSTMEFVTPEHTTNRHTRVAAADEKDGIG
jgi:hypothetical protein